MNSTRLPPRVPLNCDYEAEIGKPAKGLRLVFPKNISARDSIPKRALPSRLRSRNWQKRDAKIVPISLPHTEYAIPTYYIIATAEASANLARFDGVPYGYRFRDRTRSQIYGRTRDEGFGAEVKRRSFWERTR